MDGKPDLISVVIAGDSHVAGFPAQQISVDVAPGRAMSVELKSNFIVNGYAALDMVVTYPDGRTGINPIFTQGAAQWPGLDLKGKPLAPGTTAEKHLVLSVGTSVSNYDPAMDYADRVANRLLFKPDVDFVLPGRTDLPMAPDCTVLPVTLMREMFEAILRPMKAALGLMAADYPDRLWVLCGPPPPPDNTILTAFLAHRAKTVVGLPQTDIVLPPPVVMLKAWLLVRECVMEICRAAGCHFIDCASFACDATGFLKPDLIHDGIHGNPRYHELMARHIATTVTAAVMAR